MCIKQLSLTFQGRFTKQIVRPGVETEQIKDPWLSSKGLRTTNLRRFEFNMSWKYWDFAILRQCSFQHLVALKVPLGPPSDSKSLGEALLSMNLLKSLTVRDIPDDARYLALLPFLGQGIISRAGSLRELDLSITNFNRPDFYDNTWRRISIEDEPFVKPPERDYFLGKFFPISIDDVHENQQSEYNAFKDSVDQTLVLQGSGAKPLRLEKLRLKRIDLPKDAFTRIFDGSHLKQLRLPYSDVDPAVWTSIRADKLITFGDINYEVFSRSLKSFVQAQTSLQSLSFLRPSNKYKSSGFVVFDHDDAPTLSVGLYTTPPPLGQGTEWCRKSCYSMDKRSKFPACEELFRVLNATRISSLLLPIDMYDITADLVCRIGIDLPFLQSLTWGFDYLDQVSTWL